LSRPSTFTDPELTSYAPAKSWDAQFARISRWCREQGVTWHTTRKGEIIRDKRTRQILRRM